MNPIFVLAVSGTLVLLLSASAFGLWAYDKRERMARVRTAVGRRAARGGGAAGVKVKEKVWQKGALDFMRVSTKRFSIMKDRQSRDTNMALVGAGFRSRDAIVVFTFFKMVTPVVFLVGSAIIVYGLDPIGRGPMGDMGAVVAAALIGSKLPDLLVKNRRQKRLHAMRKSLPDALDMLVICAEAGLGSDASLKRVVAETSRKASVLGEELNQTVLELSFMPERRTALENLAARAPLPAINAFVNTLIQAEKYGTPLARAFKVLSQEQRNERMMRAEEKAGRLPATMTVPMMIFILPALFVVLIGPAILDIMDNFIGMEH
jgi:tight adherence protein C